jgi:hypothetical protein
MNERRDTLGLGYLPFDISDTTGNSAKLAGGTLQANGTYRAGRSMESSWSHLPLPGGWLLTNSLARGLSPDARWYAGYATRLNGSTNQLREQVAVLWDAASGYAFTNLITAGFNANNTARANAVNSAGAAVGSLTITYQTGTNPVQYIRRGFRTAAGGVAVVANDHLPPLPTTNTASYATEALAISETGWTVGISEFANTDDTVIGVSALWTNRVAGTNYAPIRIGTLTQPGIPTAWRHAANSINSGNQIVGWMSSDGMNRKAYWRTAGDKVYDLNDSSIVYKPAGASSAVLEEGVDISDVGFIVVNGKLNNSNKAFLPIKR